MKKITHAFVALLVLVATTALAVEPIAVWSGDLGEEKAGFSFALNGNTLNADGTITMSAISSAAKLGVALRSTTAAYSASTIIFEVEGMTIPSADGAAIVSTYSNASGYDDYCGMRVTNSGETYGIWNNNKWGGTNNCQTHRVNSAAELGAATRVALVYVQNKSKGTQGYMMINGTLTKIFGATGLVSTTAGMGARGWNILGAGCDTTANRPITKMAGAKLKNVAIFNSELTTGDIADYEFPDPGVEYETFTYDKFLTTTFVDTGWNFDLSKLENSKITGTMSGGNIANKPAASTGYWVEGPDASGVMKFQMQVYQYNHATDHYLKVVEVELKKGDNGNVWIRGVRAGYTDGGTTDPKGSIKITNWNATFVTNETAGGYGVNKVVVEVPVNPLDPPVEVDCGTEYSMNDANAVTGDTITLKFADAGGTLLIDEAPTRKYTIKCAGAMEILGDDDYTITQTDFNKLTLSQVSGGLTIDATGGLEMNDAIKSAIKAATSDKTYTFIGAGDNGATLDFTSPSNTKTLKTHLVFDGGTHTFKQNGAENSTLLSNGSIENPSIFVTGGATFTLMGKDVTGYSGAYIANGVIKVDDGATLEMRRLNSGNTFFYRQQVCLMPGATMRTYGSETIELYGGAADGVYEIYVPDSAAGNTKAATITGNFQFRVGNSNDNIAAYVGENSILKVEKFTSYSGNGATLYKRGAGKLEFTGSGTTTAVNVQAGSLGLNGTINDLTFGAEGVLNLDNGAPTVTGSLVTAIEKQLKLAITPPVLHDMPVITLPAAVDKTGWTAYVNGRVETNDLKADGNMLKLVWKIPPTIAEIDSEADIETTPSVDYTKSTVSVKVNYSDRGDYDEDNMGYQIIIGEKAYTGVASGEGDKKTVSFEIDELEGGKIYRGEFQVVYGEYREVATTAPIVIRQGNLVYDEKDPWVNETPTTLKNTGTYEPDTGVSVVDNMIQINTNTQVTFTPTPDPDYVDKCDSSFTISIIADEAIDDSDQTIEEGAQAGVQIVADDEIIDGVKFQFIVGDAWKDGPKAALNTPYEVTISFHYAKEEGDKDSVTYTVKDLTQEPVVADRRENTANKVEEIIFYDGCQFASLVGTCQIETADPVPQGIKPGEEAEIKADNDEDAQEQAKKMPVLIPDDDADVVAALDTPEKKEVYKALFKVIAVKKNGSYTAEVVFDDDKISTIKDDEENILTEVVKALGSLLGEEGGELENIKGQPGLYYGIAADGELVNMGEAQPEEWKIADKDGNIVGLKVKKTANAKQGFYKVICTPKPTKKDK